jgi:hypothetical protein
MRTILLTSLFAHTIIQERRVPKYPAQLSFISFILVTMQVRLAFIERERES